MEVIRCGWKGKDDKRFPLSANFDKFKMFVLPLSSSPIVRVEGFSNIGKSSTTNRILLLTVGVDSSLQPVLEPHAKV